LGSNANDTTNSQDQLRGLKAVWHARPLSALDWVISFSDIEEINFVLSNFPY